MVLQLEDIYRVILLHFFAVI